MGDGSGVLGQRTGVLDQCVGSACSGNGHDAHTWGARSRRHETVTHPIEGQVIMLAGAKASVPLHRMKPLLAQTANYLRDVDLEQYELVFEDDERAIRLAHLDFWHEHGEAMDLADREWDAIRRAHEQQLRRVGRREDRREEFETALEIRTAVVVGTNPD